jgi:beta-lactamase regulating signal transducer with metallopeptidase domain
MASELLSLLIWASATLSVGIVIVLALRVPVRRVAGARVAYLLWLIPPLGFLAWLAPARQVIVTLPASVTETGGAVTVAAIDWQSNLLVGCWLVGLTVMIAVFRFRQRRFEAAAGQLEPVMGLGRDVFAAAPTHGPAVIGAFRPVIVLPRDFGSRFSSDEQALILAHERVHVERGDPLVNAAALVTRAVHWFNPLVHVAVRALRVDQELACDATVVERHGGARRTYAEAMLKSHAPAFEVPVGCAWHSSAFHPMKERILMLKASPSRFSRGLGLSFVACAALGVAGAVWLMRPVDVLAAAPEEEAAVQHVDVDETDLAIVEAHEAMIEAREAAREARAAMKEAKLATKAEVRQALREARAAVKEAKIVAKVEVRHALREAQAALAAARSQIAVDMREAMKSAEPAIAAAQEAIANAQPAIAVAEQALREAEPAIEAARKAAIAVASREVRAAVATAKQAEASAMARAKARLDAACRRAMTRSSEAGEDEFKALEKLVCIAPVQRAPAD